MKAYNLDHVGIAVRDLDAALAGYKTRYGIEALHRELVADQGVEEAMLALGGSYIQLITPIGDDSPVARFLDRRGDGLHHIAFAVLDLEVALAHLESEGCRLIDRHPRRGGRDTRIAFVHPSDLSGTLIELVEHADS